MASAYSASIFIIVPINDVMAAVFYAPVPTVGLEDVVGISLLRCLAGDAVSGFSRDLSGLFIDSFAFDHKGLSNVGEGEIPIELGSNPDLACLDPAVVKINGDSVRCLAPLKIQGKIFEQSGLIAFDGKMVMSPSVFDQVASQSTLRQESVGTDGFSFDADRFKQGNGHGDFVGLLELIATVTYRQGADFFWVWHVLL